MQGAGVQSLLGEVDLNKFFFKNQKKILAMNAIVAITPDATARTTHCVDLGIAQ